MSLSRALALAALLLCARWAQGEAPPGNAPAGDVPRILVMMPLAPEHFRPDNDYPGGYDPDAGQEAQRRLAGEVARAHGLMLEQGWAMPSLGLNCYRMALAPGDSVEEKLAELARDGRVESAQVSNLFRALAHPDPLYEFQPSASLWHLDDLHRSSTGRGVLLAEIDSGVDLGHPDLAGQIAGAENFVDASSLLAEEHGTAVAGVLVARADNGIGITGIAPGARLLALRACWESVRGGTACDSFTLAKALQFAINRGARIINMSLAGPRDRLLGRLLDAAWSRGIVVVVAADSSRADGGFPAAHAHVVSVGQQSAQGQGDVPGVDALAPGSDVPTTRPGGGWGFVSGSSFAAAHVSGLVALLLERAPSMGPLDVIAALSPAHGSATTARRVSPGRIDACDALARVSRGAPPCLSEAGSGAASMP